MDLSLNLQQKLETKLALTPQLKQSLEILKFSMQELETYIKETANANPLIELKQSDKTLEMARLQKHDHSRISNFSTDESFDPLLQVASQGESIEFYLMEQLAMLKNLTRIEKEVVLYFIRSLNDVGYLDCVIEEVAEQFHVSIQTGEKLLSVLQSFEPVGIGARNLAECLYLQIIRNEDAPKNAATLVKNHLEDLANRNFQSLAHQYKISIDEVQHVFAYIQQLNPHPIIEVQVTKQEYIIPDLIVEKYNDEYVLRINDIFLPQISINSYYEELLRANEDDETNEYLKTKLSDAVLLIRGIEQRHETLYKVTKVILQQQKSFLLKGKKALVPLRLKDIAEIVELHESTISRTINHKYIQTPQGTFALKNLFVRGVITQSGEVESILLIKEKIKSIIEKEDSKKPLSDQKIANILMAEGIQIARRTVAKYREELGILQSTKRAHK